MASGDTVKVIYLYTGDAIRKKKYNYTLDLVSGTTGTASTTAKYF